MSNTNDSAQEKHILQQKLVHLLKGVYVKQLGASCKELSTSKKIISDFVKDMSKIEQDEFTLRTSIAELRETATNDIKRVEKKLEDLTSRRDSVIECKNSDKKTIENLENDIVEIPDAPICPEFPKEVDEWADSQKIKKYEATCKIKERKIEAPRKPDSLLSNFGLSLLLWLLVFAGTAVAILLSAAALDSYLNLSLTSAPYALAIAVGAIELFLVPTIFTYVYSKKDRARYKKELSEYNQLSKLKTIVEDYDKNYHKYSLDYKEYERRKKEAEYKNGTIGANISHFSKRIKKAEKEIPDLENQLELAANEKNEVYVKSGLLYAQADILQEKADNIYFNKMQLYNLGIVPPDYRTFDAMVMINTIFLNDQADTMREATLLYDERVARQEILRGINRIYTMLGRLAASMHAIETRLVEVRNEIRVMNTELYSISDKLDSIDSNIKINTKMNTKNQESISSKLYDIAQNRYKSNENASTNYLMQSYEHKLLQDAILEQTKASEYAAYSAANAAYRQEWYMNQYRQRLL